MADTKITDLTPKVTGDADDEFIINDVTNGNVDKKVGMDGLRITESQITDLQTYLTDATGSALADGTVWLGNDSNVAVEVTPTGDVTMTNAGVTAIGATKVTNAMLAGSIAASKLIGTDIDTVGTIGTGVWEGTVVASAFLDADTAHLSGTQTFTGTKTLNSFKGTGAVTVTNILDEDAMGTDSATALATQQSIKAYVDSSTGGALTAGSIAFSNGTTLAEDNTNLFFDDTNNRVGLGLNTPLDTLHISGAQELDHTAAEDDDHALELVVDAAGFGDVKGVDIDYITGAVAATEEEETILVNIDESASTGGEIEGYEVLSTAEGSAAIHGYSTGINIDPVRHNSGTFGNMDSALNVAVDVLAALSSGGAGNISAFVNDDDTVTIGDAAIFSEMEIILGTGSSGGGIAPTFEYSQTGDTWATFSPADGTNGFRNTGAILWDSNDLTGFAVHTDSEYKIRITRTRNTLSTTPIIDEVQIAAVTIYSWDKDGVVNIFDLESNTISASDGTLAQTIADSTGVSTFVSGTVLVAPVLGTPASGTLTNTDGYPGDSSLVTVGTIASGTWEGDVVASGFLDADTMHISVAQTVTGKKTFGTAGAVGDLAVAGTTSGSTVIDATAIASGVLTLPAATDTLVGKATTDVFTNKSYDLGGTGNVLTGSAAEFNTALQTETFSMLNVAETFSAVKTFSAAPVFQDNIKASFGTGSDSTIVDTGSGMLIDIDEQNAGSKSLVIESDATALLTINDTSITSSVFLDVPDIETATVSARDGTLAQTIADSTGVSTFVSGTVLVAPVLGTPASGNLGNCTVIPMAQASGILPDANMPNLTGDVTTVEGAVATTIASKAVHVSMLDDGTDGELITWDSSGVATTVPAGTAGDVLTSAGSGAEPTFQNPVWTVIESYEAGSAEATHTFTFTAVDFDDDSVLVMEIDATATLQLNLLVQVNGITGSNYYTDGSRILAGAIAYIDLNAQTSGQIASTTVFNAVNRGANGTLRFHLNKSGTFDRINCNFEMAGSVSLGYETGSVACETASTDISSITILTSTSTWQTGSRMTLYKVARAVA